MKARLKTSPNKLNIQFKHNLYLGFSCMISRIGDFVSPYFVYSVWTWGCDNSFVAWRNRRRNYDAFQSPLPSPAPPRYIARIAKRQAKEDKQDPPNDLQAPQAASSGAVMGAAAKPFSGTQVHLELLGIFPGATKVGGPHVRLVHSVWRICILVIWHLFTCFASCHFDAFYHVSVSMGLPVYRFRCL